MDKELAISTTRDSAKKRLMFVTHDDFYFLTYNLLLVLLTLKCTKMEKAFVDVKKIAFLIDLISDNYLATVVRNAVKKELPVSNYGQELLSKSYSKSKDRVPFINRLAYALEKKGYVTILANQEEKTSDIFLNVDMLPSEFLKSDLFKSEAENFKLIQEAFSRVRTVSLKTFLNNLFRKNGVATWLD